MDWDNDNDFDLLVGDRNGVIWFFRNTGTNTSPVLNPEGYIQANGVNIDVGANATPVVVDWNNDSKKDLVVGNEDYEVRVYLNIGTDAVPVFGSHSVAINSNNLMRNSPEVFDLNGDGKKDLIVGEEYGYVYFFPNVGTDQNPSFTAATGQKLVLENGQDLHVNSRAHIDFVDWNLDGAQDLIVGDNDGYITAFLNNMPLSTITSNSPDCITNNTTPSNFSALLKNGTAAPDTFYLDVQFDGPASWITEYTTVNGTFPAGTPDSVIVNAGDSTTITVQVDPNGADGFGQSKLQFVSGQNNVITGEQTFRNITETGIEVLLIEADDEYGDSLLASIERIYNGTYGMVSRSALQPTTVNLDNFQVIAWSAGNKLPAFYPEEVNKLQTFMDNGGNLFLCGQDVGRDIFEPNGQSQFAQGFYNNYLHAAYYSDASNLFLLNGVSGDPIGDGLQVIIGAIYARSADVIGPYDAQATVVLTYFNGPNIGAIKASTSNYRTVYCAFSPEQITERAARDTLIARGIAWLREIILTTNNEPQIANAFTIEQNYPNPFNPTTMIKFDLPKTSEVTLKIFNILGEEVVTLVSDRLSTGSYSYEWDASNLASGVYLYRLQAGDYIETRKMVLMR